MASRFTSVLVLLVVFSTVAFAQQIYKWKDNKGQWHFSDHPPAEVRAERVKGLDIGPVPPLPPQTVGGQCNRSSRRSGASSARMAPICLDW